LVVEVSHRQFRPEGAERLGAAPGDRLIVGDADDQPAFSLEELGFDGGNRARRGGTHGATPFLRQPIFLSRANLSKLGLPSDRRRAPRADYCQPGIFRISGSWWAMPLWQSMQVFCRVNKNR